MVVGDEFGVVYLECIVGLVVIGCVFGWFFVVDWCIVVEVSGEIGIDGLLIEYYVFVFECVEFGIEVNFGMFV